MWKERPKQKKLRNGRNNSRLQRPGPIRSILGAAYKVANVDELLSRSSSELPLLVGSMERPVDVNTVHPSGYFRIALCVDSRGRRFHCFRRWLCNLASLGLHNRWIQ